MPTLTAAEAPLAPRPSTRRRLPDTRRSVTHKFSVGSLEGYVIVGLYEDGRPGEVFLKVTRHGSTVSGLADTVAVLTSLALQHGVSAETLARKLEYTRFEPSGRTRDPEVRFAHSLTDYVFRWLGREFGEAAMESAPTGEGKLELSPSWGHEGETLSDVATPGPEPRSEDVLVAEPEAREEKLLRADETPAGESHGNDPADPTQRPLETASVGGTPREGNVAS